MLAGVIGHRRARIAAAAGILLAFTGVWVAHTLEYLRVWGSTGLLDSVTNSVHAYMLPVAAVLVVACIVFGLGILRAWRVLNDRLDRAAAGVRRIWRGTSGDPSDGPAPLSSPGVRLLALWLPLGAAQLVIYLLQENIEAIARGQAAPGLGAVTGIHWAAPFVHLYVALLLACGVRICQILLHRRAAVVERVEALLRAMARRRHTAVGRVALPVPRWASPLDRLGTHLWRRPPPLLLDV